jgi:transcriptional regulator with XRE-family HTH domain
MPVEPRDTAAAIGARLRAARQQRSLTIAQLADATGLSKGFLSRVERDRVSPSVATLVMLCDVLHVGVGELFSAPDTIHVPWDEAPAINLGGHLVAERLLSPRQEARLQVLRTQAAPGDLAGAGKDLYTVNTDVEFLHVIKGTVRVTLAAQHWDLRPGDSLTLEGREPHTWEVLDPADGVDIIWVLVPAAWTGTV